MDWNESIRRIGAGEDVEHVLDLKSAADNEDFRAFFLKEAGPEALARYDARIQEINSGVYGARMAWHSISGAQRRALWETERRGPRFERCGKEYRVTQARHQPYVPVYIRTIRALCAHGLLAWDGGAFDPEAAAVLTERGRFVLAHGRTTDEPVPSGRGN